MKTFHYINFGIIFLFLVGICIIEEVYVSRSLKDVFDNCFLIEQQVKQEGNLVNSRVCLLVDNLEYKWEQEEGDLCYMVNHKNIQELGQEISKLKGYVQTNDIGAFTVSLQTIKFYCQTYMHFMGASLHNVL